MTIDNERKGGQQDVTAFSFVIVVVVVIVGFCAGGLLGSTNPVRIKLVATRTTDDGKFYNTFTVGTEDLVVELDTIPDIPDDD